MRFFVGFSLLFLSLLSFADETFLKDKDYVVLENQVRPFDPSKIEVLEVFSYHCPHCLHFEPLLESWVKKQSPDVAFVQMHAAWAPFMEPLQRGFYTAVTLKLQPKIQMAVFKEFQEKRNMLDTAKAWAELMEPYGVSKETVIATYDSLAVSSRIKIADSKIRSYKISGTPALIVDGKYRIDSPASKDAHQKMLAIADFLINKIRSERRGK